MKILPIKIEAQIDKNKGTTLLEALIAMVILVVGLLGIINLEAKLIDYGGRAEERIKATLMANELIGMAYADSSNANCYVYPIAGQVGCGSAVASGFTTTWANNVLATLPNSTITATLGVNNTYTITIQWKETRELFTHNTVSVTHIGA